MKPLRLLSLATLLSLVVLFSCRPDRVAPAENVTSSEVAAFLDDEHPAPDPICGPDTYASLVNPQFGSQYPLGQVRVVNGNQTLYVGIQPSAGLLISDAAVWFGDSQTDPPLQSQTTMDLGQFQLRRLNASWSSIWSFSVPLTDLQACNNLVVWAKVGLVDANGQPTNEWEVFGNGVATTGGFVMNYCLQACPSMPCQPWSGGNNPCNVPCPVTLNFNADANGDPIPAGTIIAEQWAGEGVHVTCDNNKWNHPDKAIIFDSSNPTGNDWDLGTPNEAFGGPGKGNGGKPGQVGQNDIAFGNLLIIAENDNDGNNDGLVDNPDDEARGGFIRFQFDNPVDIAAVTLVDLDDATGGSVMSCSLPNGSKVDFPIPDLGNNSIMEVPINLSDVTDLKVTFTGSGSLANIKFCPGNL